MITWFRRLADVPKLGYQGNPDIDRSSLPHHNAQPEIQAFTMDGKRHESIDVANPYRIDISISSAAVGNP